MKMGIREAKVEDIEQMTKLLQQVAKLHSDNRTDIFKEKEISDYGDWAKVLLEDDEKIVMIAEKEKIICGVMVCKMRVIENHVNFKDSKILSIDEICVDEKYRKEGIGTKLIEEAKKLAKDNNCNRLELNCWEFNENAMNFYFKQGFKVQRRFLEMEIKEDYNEIF